MLVSVQPFPTTMFGTGGPGAAWEGGCAGQGRSKDQWDIRVLQRATNRTWRHLWQNLFRKETPSAKTYSRTIRVAARLEGQPIPLRGSQLAASHGHGGQASPNCTSSSSSLNLEFLSSMQNVLELDAWNSFFALLELPSIWLNFCILLHIASCKSFFIVSDC